MATTGKDEKRNDLLRELLRVTNLAGGTSTATSSLTQITGSGTKTTTSGAKFYSLFFRGTGGSVSGVSVPDNYILEAAWSGGLASISYIVPTVNGADSVTEVILQEIV